MFSNKRWTIARRGRHNQVMGLILVLIATILSIPAAIAGDIRAVEIGDREVTLRFADVVAGASALVLAGPDRIALDILGADPGRSPQGSGLVSAVRQGWPAADTARVVLDLARPAVVTDARFAADGRSLSVR
ncbi:MAG: AMIN domain-containing protein, partial [Sphingopyxis terrae]